MRFFAERMKIVVEPTGCLAAAAALNGIVPCAGQRVGVVISGGNVDPKALAGYLGLLRAFSALTIPAPASISRPTRARARRGLFDFHSNPIAPGPGAMLAGSGFQRRGHAMANTVSAKKMTRKIAKRTAINRSRRSRMRTFLRKVEEAIASGNQTEAAAALRAAEPELMRAAQKGIVHKNTASRKVSRLASRIKTISA